MDYEIAYKEVLDNAKKVLLDCTSDERNVVEYIFPELRESEEEKIKKELIDYIKSFPEKICLSHNKEDVIAWLEKNGEQKTIEEVNGDDYGIDALWHAQRILEKTLGSVDGYQTDDGILEHKAAITIVKKLYEQKPVEWSDEDEKMFRGVIAICDIWSTKTSFYSKENDDIEKLKNWLKSIKDRIQPNQWIPSDEQIKAVDIAIRCGIQLGTWEETALKTLSKQLKELRNCEKELKKI